MRQGWAGKCQVSPSKQADDEEKKRHVKTCQKWAAPRAGEGLDFGLSLWPTSSPIRPCSMRLPVELAAVASFVNRGACLHGTTFCGLSVSAGLVGCPLARLVAWSQHDRT